MPDTKTYLSVPYAQKDEAKALGARWDATSKKWYVPADKDITLFAKWQPDTAVAVSPTTVSSKSKSSAANKTSVSTIVTSGVITYAADKNFVAYSGNEPPWD
ncbi:MAG: DUF5710 domain-containing protein [Methylococcaceae bacterium]|nr:DUF5710 domain-containing protein [Methylococcaceae bacterium]MDP3389291.1 DUF5710 domain-containing protein [Methylococcaceae bacterium]MDP3932413.1 DUF5710 domain-containing protein [Methylococcaceae bacterium]MDZ4155646.1 DUF5710 domain-containing protein [Methylococcales bacterium]